MTIPSEQQLNVLRKSITSIPDYPKSGILFRDISSLLVNHQAYSLSIELLVAHYRNCNINKVVGSEARGFLFAAPVALALGIGFVPVRKAGKLPRATVCEQYELEYGQDSLEMHIDAIQPGERVLIIDDLLATGGTTIATIRLIRRLQGIVNDAAFIITLPALGAEKSLRALDINCFSLLQMADT